jgi:hypothetical protein
MTLQTSAEGFPTWSCFARIDWIYGIIVLVDILVYTCLILKANRPILLACLALLCPKGKGHAAQEPTQHSSATKE